MKEGKNSSKALIIISSVILIFLIFSISFFFTLISRDHYDKNFTENGAYKELGVSGVRKITDNLINYLISENSEINEVQYLFTEREVDHLKDVSALISWIKYLSIAILLGFIGIIYWLYTKDHLKQNIKKILLYSGTGIITITIILIILTMIDFNSLFLGFHKVFFPQGNYVFTKNHLLIKLFPATFFGKFFVKMIIQAAIVGIVFIGGSFFLPKDKTKPKTSKENKKGKTKKKKSIRE